jgi:phage gpG-like protein
MITATSNIQTAIKNILNKLSVVTAPDELLREVAVNMLGEVKQRIHVKGEDATGNKIGVYSDGYMKVRTGDFANATKVSRGKNAGKRKDSGTKTKGVSAGTERPRYNRTNDSKVVISLTRQMENDFSVIATAKGYGLGYSNPENTKKVGYVEETYKKKIFALTKEEKEKAAQIAGDFIKNKLNG